MPQSKVKIVLISQEDIKDRMAGPAIRYFELARTLSKHFKVILLAPRVDLKLKDNTSLEMKSHQNNTEVILGQIRGCQYVITQSLRPTLISKLKKWKIPYIADLYDPILIESLEYNKFELLSFQNRSFDFQNQALLFQLYAADHILAASPRQADFYLGLLLSHKIIAPANYRLQQSPDSLMTLLPFGLPNEPFAFHDKQAIEKRFANITKNDKVVYWGGGIWNWFDPISVIKAFGNLAKTRNDLKLVFIGTRHPNPKIKEMAMFRRAYDLAEKRDWIDKTVFFNQEWVPYEERVNFLGRARIGISTHFDTLETRFAFRTRILDYLWAELPMVVTKGDYLADIISQNQLGFVTGYNDVGAIEKAILALTSNNNLYKEIKSNIKAYKHQFVWDKVSEELAGKIKSNLIKSKPLDQITFFRNSTSYYLAGFKKKVFNR